MLFEKHGSSTPWYATDTIIDSWLQERQHLLGLLYRILQIPPFEDDNNQDLLIKELLPEFCQILVDYMSAGHFKVFEKIAATTTINQKLIINILRTTIPAIEFSYLYATGTQPLTTLKDDLDKLAKQIAKRLDWEDKLIQGYSETATQQNPVSSCKNNTTISYKK